MFKNKKVIDEKMFEKFLGGFVEIRKGGEIQKGLLESVGEYEINFLVLSKIKEMKKDFNSLASTVLSMVELGENDLLPTRKCICVSCIERIDEMEFGLVIISKNDKEEVKE